MSTATTAPHSLLARTRVGAIILAVVAPLGPLLLGVAHVVSPFGVGDFATSYAGITAHPLAVQYEILFTVLGAVFGSLGALVVGAAIRVGSPKFGAVATAITFVGFAVRGTGAQTAPFVAAPAAGVTAEQAIVMFEGVQNQLQSAVFGQLFTALFVGLLLLGIAAIIAARQGLFPLWRAILILASAVLLLVIGSLMLAGLLPFQSTGFGWLLVSVAFGAAGAVYVRQTLQA